MPFSSPCPAPVTLHHSGRNELVTKTITATDGGTATATVSKINIDASPPKLHIMGATNAQTYAHVRRLECIAHDAVSGLTSCTIQQSRHTHHGVTRISWEATAIDVAGNTATRRGDYYLRLQAAARRSQPRDGAVSAGFDL